MSILSKGILGGVSGKVESVVGANFRGMDVLRSVSGKSKKAPSCHNLSKFLKSSIEWVLARL